MKSRNSYIGQPMERTEDLRFLRGRGTYVADVNRPGQLYAVILRSSGAHGKIDAIDVSRAMQLPGVRHVVVGPDLGHAVPSLPLRSHPRPPLVPFHQPLLPAANVPYAPAPLAAPLPHTPP